MNPIKRGGVVGPHVASTTTTTTTAMDNTKLFDGYVCVADFLFFFGGGVRGGGLRIGGARGYTEKSPSTDDVVDVTREEG